MKRVLRPIYDRPEYAAPIEREINDYFREAIFAPLFAMLAQANVAVHPKFKAISYDETGRENEGETAVTAALASGALHYADGQFTGQFNAAISKELRAMGATFSSRGGIPTFTLQQGKLPLYVRYSVYASKAKGEALHKAMSAMLQQMAATVAIAATGFKLGSAVDTIVIDLQKQFVATVKGIESISVSPSITPGIRERITKELTENLDLYVKNFAAEEIPELRRLVEANAFAGYRVDRLAKIIEARFGVTQRKAAFLARQETSLLVSKYREARYQSIGCNEYVWRTMEDSRVRPTRPRETNNHRVLNGRVFSWSQPPVVDTANGRRCHPGQDYGCRCIPLPVLNLAP